MKKTLKITGLSILIIVALLVIVNQFSSRSIRTEIVINATAEDVWKVLLDHQEYPQWNPFIKKISGSTQQGEYLEVTIQSEGNDPMDFTPVVLINNENQEFRWIGKLLVKGVFDGEHYFILEEIDSSRTRFIQGENFTGILSGIFMGMIKEDTEGGFNAMNKALKKRSENN